ncbi:MAG: RluA family pseudouridine synthase, partial [Rhodospirillales bacterium]|nr:RluA family pseudouridine synthase [Rhodospirillales bacterium]
MTDDPETARRYQVAVAPADSGTRLDRLLARHLPQLSRSRIKALVVAGQVTAAGATLSDPSYRVKPGQCFAITVPKASAAKPQGQPIALDIVYEDADLIVVNKPAGMAVHPAPGNPDKTLVNALIAHCGKSLSGIGGEIRPGIVHRLDKDTSGLIVAAKNDPAHRALSAAFAAHDIERAYLAIVWGTPVPAAGEISGNIGRHPTDRKRMAIVARGGKAALTRYRVLRRLGPTASLVECRLATGRTHQIRVHMAAIGHPVVGDQTYGRMTAVRSSVLSEGTRMAVQHFHRQALHAYLLGFKHPHSLTLVRWDAEMPNDM